MTTVLLDTSAYSAWKRGHSELAHELEHAETIAISAIVAGELRSGFRRGTQATRNEAELQRLLGRPGVHAIEVGDETSRRYALVIDNLRRAGIPVPTNDAWIAATAMEHGLEIWTCDSDFERIPGVLVRRFEVDRPG